MIENRRSYRLPVKSKVLFSDRKKIRSANALNISTGGIFVSLLDLEGIRSGDVFSAMLLLDDKTAPVFLKIQVKRLVAGSGSPEIAPGLGFQFVDLGPAAQLVLEYVEDLRRAYELAGTLLAAGEPELKSLYPLFSQLHLKAVTDMSDLKQEVEGVLKAIDQVESANRRFDSNY